MGVWLVAAGTVTGQELSLAGATGLGCAWLAVVLRGIYDGQWRLVSAWGLPVAIVRDVGVLFSADTSLRKVDVRPAVKAVKTIVMSASPGTVVLDDRNGSLLVHTLGRR
ncbi:hypothetical protein GCM10029964_070140 [Kibdelosporangium lantanae]